MRRWLFVLIILIPIIEISSIIAVSGWIGGMSTFLLLLAISIIGGYAAKQEGKKVMLQARQQMNEGQIPGYSLVNGFCVLVGGILLLIPGFISDIFGLLLLVPFTRVWFQGIMLMWIEKAMKSGNFIIRRF